VNEVALNVYHTGEVGISQHYDNTNRFEAPIVSLRLYSDSRLTFGAKGLEMSGCECFVPMPRGGITILEPNGFVSCDELQSKHLRELDSGSNRRIGPGWKHCVRPTDMAGHSAVVILRHVHNEVLRQARTHLRQAPLRAAKTSEDALRLATSAIEASEEAIADSRKEHELAIAHQTDAMRPLSCRLLSIHLLGEFNTKAAFAGVNALHSNKLQHPIATSIHAGASGDLAALSQLWSQALMGCELKAACCALRAAKARTLEMTGTRALAEARRIAAEANALVEATRGAEEVDETDEGALELVEEAGRREKTALSLATQARNLIAQTTKSQKQTKNEIETLAMQWNFELSLAPFEPSASVAAATATDAPVSAETESVAPGDWEDDSGEDEVMRDFFAEPTVGPGDEKHDEVEGAVDGEVEGEAQGEAQGECKVERKPLKAKCGKAKSGKAKSGKARCTRKPSWVPCNSQKTCEQEDGVGGEEDWRKDAGQALCLGLPGDVPPIAKFRALPRQSKLLHTFPQPWQTPSWLVPGHPLFAPSVSAAQMMQQMAQLQR